MIDVIATVGVLVCGSIFILQCCLCAASDADEQMARLMQKKL